MILQTTCCILKFPPFWFRYTIFLWFFFIPSMNLPVVLRVLGPILQTMLFSKCSVFNSLLFSPHCSAMGCLYCAHYLLLDTGKSQIYIFIEFIFLNAFPAIRTIWELSFKTYLYHSAHVDLHLPGGLSFLNFFLTCVG